MWSIPDLHVLGFGPAHLEAKLFCLLTVDTLSITQLTVRFAEQEGVVGVFHVVSEKGQSVDPQTYPAHQMVDEAVEVHSHLPQHQCPERQDYTLSLWPSQCPQSPWCIVSFRRSSFCRDVDVV